MTLKSRSLKFWTATFPYPLLFVDKRGALW